ncbi:o-succinylbenzoate--CoA ligase [Variovorax sp. WS11]|uniref:class I adenylate-forming enzyme family protein n=1 Tax=Variovorax sp. WS11 TaxID=1105204 RepID=UPI000D0E1745|nr:AMP-binding protein [Variovorax sp. WS11]NDZ17577.1 long-chain fatty acid--CoA ligase [Variovorax sp. WS11]PSL82218.1 o-succinylbenzoate--CoA ligase [Variovorax sp. WS11]
MLLIDYFDKGAEVFPGRSLVHDGERGWSYAEMKRLTHRIANGLIRQDLQVGAPVATYSPNHPLSVACQYGIIRAGLVWVPINARNSVHDNIEVMKLLGVQCLFFHSAIKAEIDRIRAAVPTLRHCICMDEENLQGPGLEQWMTDGPTDEPYFARSPQDVVSMPTTSGTTGKPKGVMLTNENWEAMVATYQIVMRHEGPPVHIVAAPLTHAAGYLCATLLSVGGTNVILPHPDPGLILEAIDRHKGSALFLPPTVIYSMLSHPKVGDFDYSSLRFFLYGGAPMSVQKLREAMQRFGPVMAQTYGQTEAPMTATLLTPRDHVEALESPELSKRLQSAGREGPLVRTRIMDDDGRLLPTGERGEVVCRGSVVMKGYYNNPQATAEVSTNGWHRTGDIGMTDKDGFVYIVDRKKDMIISGGFNVYPTEVEQILWTHPSVQDCAVIGAPDDKWGEAVTAIVELKAGVTATEAELIALCKERIGSVKAPKRVEFWAALPRSAVGKVLKREIRRKFWEGRERAI